MRASEIIQLRRDFIKKLEAAQDEFGNYLFYAATEAAAADWLFENDLIDVPNLIDFLNGDTNATTD